MQEERYFSRHAAYNCKNSNHYIRVMFPNIKSDMEGCIKHYSTIVNNATMSTHRLNIIYVFVSCSYYFLLFSFFSYFYAGMGFFMLPTNNKVSDRRSLTKNRNGLSIFTVFWKKFAESTPISTPEIVL